MMDWFNSREPRERILLIVMAALLTLFIAWFALNRETGPDADQVLAEAQTDRELWLRAKPKLTADSGNNVARGEFSRGDLINLARQRDVRLTRVQPQNDGSLTVWIDDIGTQPLFGLMQALTKSYRVDFSSVIISRSPQGSLNAQFTLLSE